MKGIIAISLVVAPTQVPSPPSTFSSAAVPYQYHILLYKNRKCNLRIIS